MNFLYKDRALGDKPDKPERFKGSSPYVDYLVNETPLILMISLVLTFISPKTSRVKVVWQNPQNKYSSL